MIEIIVLIFLCMHINKLAIRKGLKPLSWIGLTVLSWLAFEFFAVGFGMISLKITSLWNLAVLGLAAGFGGYLLIRFILERKPDKTDEEDINNIGHS